MSGNATEEYLLTRLDYPGHADPSRFAGLTGSIAALVSGLAVSEITNGPSGFVVGAAVGLFTGAAVYRRLSRRALDRQAQELVERRAIQVADTEQKLSDLRNGEARK